MKENKKSILIVDDEIEMRVSCRKILEYRGYTVFEAGNGEEALHIFESNKIDLVLVDIRMPHMNGIELMRKMREMRPDILFIVISAFPTIENAIETTKQGAFDFLVKPFSQAQLEFSITRAFTHQELIRTKENLLSQLRTKLSSSNIIGNSEKFYKAIQLAEKAAKTDVNVLLIGESGTGKELIARYIHVNSSRGKNPFIVVDCYAIPESLVESELFGYEKGAFTGAFMRKIGLFERAHLGTIFLDEVAEIPLNIQIKLLRVLQEKKFRRIGGNKEIFSNFRVISATNKNIEECIRNNTFREDLYYRLNVVTIELPPLRERKGDVTLLTKYFIKKYAPEINPMVKGISKEALEILEKYPWPGNIRELENLIQQILVIAKNEIINVDDLPEKVKLNRDLLEVNINNNIIEKDYKSIKKTIVERFKEKYFLKLLEKHNWNITKAAHDAGVNRKTMERFTKKFLKNSK